MKKFFSILLALALVLVVLPTSGVQAQKPVAYESSIQIRNLSSDAGMVTINFYNLAGLLQGTANVDIAGDETLSFLQDTMPIAPGFDGSVVVASNVPTAGVSNLHGLKSGGAAISYASFSSLSAGSTELYLPILMKDNWGYDTFFYVQNLGDEDATVTITYSDGVTATAGPIKPGAAKMVKQAAEAHTDKFFAATLASEQPIGATVVQEGGTLLAYNGFNAGAIAPIMPLVQENNYGFWSSVQIQNAGSTTTDVTVTYTPSDVGEACTEKRTIAPGESKIFAQAVMYMPIPGDDVTTTCEIGTRFVGSAAVTENSAAQPLVSVVNQNNTNDLKGGSYNAFDPALGGKKLIFPLIMDRNWDYFTSWSIFNVSGATIPAEGIVCTITGGGETYTLKNAEALADGAAWTQNHFEELAPGFVGGATCVSTGKVIGTSNQFGMGARYNGIDSLLVSEGIVVP